MVWEGRPSAPGHKPVVCSTASPSLPSTTARRSIAADFNGGRCGMGSQHHSRYALDDPREPRLLEGCLFRAVHFGSIQLESNGAGWEVTSCEN